MYGEFGPRSGDDLLLFGTRELSQHRRSDGRWRLYSQAIHEHRTGRSHDGQEIAVDIGGWGRLDLSTERSE
jgi:hypothetical protein